MVTYGKSPTHHMLNRPHQQHIVFHYIIIFFLKTNIIQQNASPKSYIGINHIEAATDDNFSIEKLKKHNAFKKS